MEQTAPVKSVAPRSARVRLIVTLLSMAAICVCVVLLAVLATDSRETDSQKLTNDRAAAASVANTFITALGTYDRSMLQGTTMPAYRASVEAVLTPKFAVAFEANGAPQAEKNVAAASVKETAQIWSTGVVAISSDQATVVVVGSLTDSIPKTAGGTDYQSLGETPFRTVLTLVRIGGRWLVDGQTPAEGIPPTAVSPSSPAAPKSSTVPTPTSGASK